MGRATPTAAQLREIYVALRGDNDGEIFTPDTVRGIKWITPANTRNALVRKGMAAADSLGSGRWFITINGRLALHDAGPEDIHATVGDFFCAHTAFAEVKQVWEANRDQLAQWGLLG